MRKYLWYLIFPCILFNVAVLGGETSISLYGPHRMGMAGEIQSVPFLGTHHTQLESPNIFIEKDFTLNSKDFLVFDADTTYYCDGKRVQNPDVIKESIHAYGVALLTYETAYDSLRRFSKKYPGLEDAQKRFNNLHVTINPYDDKSPPNNAYYRRTGKVGGIGELSFGISDQHRMVRYFDVVSHEMSHADHHALQPKHWNPGTAYAALRESFADLMVYFTSVELAVLTGRTDAAVEDIESEEFHLAPGFRGEAYIRKPSTYSLTNPCLYKKCALEDRRYPCKEHNQSNHFTNFVMQSMKQVSQELSREQTLEIIRAFQDTLILTVIATPKFNTLHDFGLKFTEWGMEIFTPRFNLENDTAKRVQRVLRKNLAENVFRISTLCPKNQISSYQEKKERWYEDEALQTAALVGSGVALIGGVLLMKALTS